VQATRQIQQEVATGSSLTVSMQNAKVFPNMVVQMASIGEESGSIDPVSSLSSLLEPLIMVVPGTIIGGLVVAMYRPIFKMGQVA
jgi:type IV pilus assembly protein PilC